MFSISSSRYFLYVESTDMRKSFDGLSGLVTNRPGQNPIENNIRPAALFRKNYLFAGSHKGAENAAMFYSFFATCKIINVNPTPD